MQNLKKKGDKTPLIQFQLFIFYKPASLQKNFHRQLLSIQVFSSDRHLMGGIMSLCGLTLLHHMISLYIGNQMISSAIWNK